MFHPFWQFSTNNLTSRNATLLFFQCLNGHDSLTCVPNLLFSDFYLSLLFNFKIGLSLGVSCLMSSMFTTILIIRLIKTMCFDSTILIAELKERFLKVGGILLLITSGILVTFTRFFAHIFRKVRSTSTLINFYHCSCIFRIITHLLMDKRFP